MKDFADYLKKIRISNHLTQTQFAAKLNIDSAALCKIENGKKELTPDKLDLLSTEFSISLDELKSLYFGEKIAFELFLYKCPSKTFAIAEEKYLYLQQKG